MDRNAKVEALKNQPLGKGCLITLLVVLLLFVGCVVCIATYDGEDGGGDPCASMERQANAAAERGDWERAGELLADQAVNDCF